MKVIQDVADRFGRYPIIFKGKNVKLEAIHDWLFLHYQGYKFAIVIDETVDEFEEQFTKSVYVYFLDEITSELEAYCK
jgi:hypothetical protein